MKCLYNMKIECLYLDTMNVPYCENCFFYKKSTSGSHRYRLSRTSKVLILTVLLLGDIIGTVTVGIANSVVPMILGYLLFAVLFSLWLNLIIEK